MPPYDYGTRTLGGKEVDFNKLVEAGNIKTIVKLLGLPQGTEGFSTLSTDIKERLDPSDPMYQQRITDFHEESMPALMRGAMSLGSGRFGGGLLSSEKRLGRKQQELTQPYLSQLTDVYKGISSDVEGAQRMTTDWLTRDILPSYRAYDFEEPEVDKTVLTESQQEQQNIRDAYPSLGHMESSITGFDGLKNVHGNVCENRGGTWFPDQGFDGTCRSSSVYGQEIDVTMPDSEWDAYIAGQESGDGGGLFGQTFG